MYDTSPVVHSKIVYLFMPNAGAMPPAPARQRADDGVDTETIPQGAWYCTIHTRRRARSPSSPMLHARGAENKCVSRINRREKCARQ